MTPKSMQSKRPKLMAKIEKIEGVYACKDLNVWEFTNGKFVASLDV
jgi:Co/Zn/Cd efflux system component